MVIPLILLNKHFAQPFHSKRGVCPEFCTSPKEERKKDFSSILHREKSDKTLIRLINKYRVCLYFYFEKLK